MHEMYQKTVKKIVSDNEETLRKGLQFVCRVLSRRLRPFGREAMGQQVLPATCDMRFRAEWQWLPAQREADGSEMNKICSLYCLWAMPF